jgi:hypothetical protein
MTALHWVFAGLWAEVWKWGIGIGLVILLLAAAYFSPLYKKYFLFAAVAVVIVLVAYTKGVSDENKRCVAQQVVVKQHVTAAVNYAKSKKALHARDPYNSRHY